MSGNICIIVMQQCLCVRIAYFYLQDLFSNNKYRFISGVFEGDLTRNSDLFACRIVHRFHSTNEISDHLI